MRRTSHALALLVLAGGLSAQAATYSPSYALGQVNSNNVWPHATSAMRYMQIHDAWTFTSTSPTVIRGVTYRPSNQSSYLNRAGGTVEVMIRIGLAATGVTSTTPSSTFDGNFDSTSVKAVFARRKINYPASGATVAELAIFDIDFPFDSSQLFVFPGNGTRSLVVETRCYSYSGGYAFDFVSSTSVIGNGYSIDNGTYAGCKNKNGQVVEQEVPTNLLYVGSAGANVIGRSFVPTIPAILSLGGLAVSVTLPGTSCDIVNDLAVLIPGATNASGEFTVSFPIPNNANLHRVSFLSQMIFFEPGANPLGIVTSRGLVNGVGAGALQSTMGIIRMKTSATDPDTVTTITNTYPNGLVMMFHM